MLNKIFRSQNFPILFLAFILISLVIAAAANSQETNSGTKELAVTTQDSAATTHEATTTSNDYVGSQECAGCHEDQMKSIEHTVHNSKAFEMRSDHGCETCHGPGKAHVESGGDVTLIKTFKNLSPRDSAAVCLTCHENGNQQHWKGSVHEMRGLACTSCHSIHSAKSDHAQLKNAVIDQICTGCHLEVKSQIQRTSHHPIREGLMSCNDCHNPHGTLTPKMITANSVNEQCYKCHTEKRGPFLWDHPPVRENCLNCHMPHGSNHEKLLAQNRPWLCQNCHLDTRHPGTLYDATNQLSSNRELARSCSNCHSAIHGSNHPSGRVFTR
ncbi:MAG TPA: DmsE family decaheme c-type cytochrome [Acidobacteriota bacterium]|jgi:DmsE family decaheme c-type cytochrome